MRCQRRVSVGIKTARNLLTHLHALNFEQQAAKPWDQLTRRCRTLGFHAVHRGGRGDCFYRSLQHQLAEAGMGDYKVAQLRSILATWLRANENFNVNVEDPAGGVTDPLRNFLVRDQYRLPVKQGDAPLLDPAFDGHDWEHFCSRVEDPVAKLAFPCERGRPQGVDRLLDEVPKPTASEILNLTTLVFTTGSILLQTDHVPPNAAGWDFQLPPRRRICSSFPPLPLVFGGFAFLPFSLGPAGDCPCRH